MDYRTLESKTQFAGQVFTVRSEVVQTPAGSTMSIDLVEHHGAVAIVAIDAEDNVLLVRQYRHPAGITLLELPAGTLEAEEPPEACARRESREEIGFDPQDLHLLGAGFMAPGYSTEFLHFFLATDLVAAPLPQDQDENIQVEAIPIAEINSLISSGEVRDVKTIAGLSLALQRLEKHR